MRHARLESLSSRYSVAFILPAVLEGCGFDMAYTLENLKISRLLPALFHMVGTSDRNLLSARHMCRFFRSLSGDPYRYTYFEEELRNHTWKEWDRRLEIFLQWLPRR